MHSLRLSAHICPNLFTTAALAVRNCAPRFTSEVSTFDEAAEADVVDFVGAAAGFWAKVFGLFVTTFPPF